MIGLFALAIACGEPGADDAGTDAGGADDSGVLDGGVDDGSLDAAPRDAEPRDAGPPPDAGPRTRVPVCYASCVSASDCDLAMPGFRPANFACEGGACVHRGCVDDDDCEGGGAQVCHSFGAEAPRCVRVCFEATDCVVGAGTPSTDADNFECLGGLCRSTGCNADVECRNSFGTDWACRAGVVNVLGLVEDVPTCVPTCAAAVDCIIGSFAFADEDNFLCADGVCQYTGCLSDVECTDMEPATCR